MIFKSNDLVLCINARPVPGMLVARPVEDHIREGADYIVRSVVSCCRTRLRLLGAAHDD